jgi:hypothetical protein
MLDLDKLTPKLPAFAFQYWDGFLGSCFVLVALALVFQGTNINFSFGMMLSGFGLIFFSMARRRGHFIGMVRVTEWSTRYKWKRAYPSILFGGLWLFGSWICFRYAAVNSHINEQWLRRVLFYAENTGATLDLSKSRPSHGGCGVHGSRPQPTADFHPARKQSGNSARW